MASRAERATRRSNSRAAPGPEMRAVNVLHLAGLLAAAPRLEGIVLVPRDADGSPRAFSGLAERLSRTARRRRCAGPMESTSHAAAPGSQAGATARLVRARAASAAPCSSRGTACRRRRSVSAAPSGAAPAAGATAADSGFAGIQDGVATVGSRRLRPVRAATCAPRRHRAEPSPSACSRPSAPRAASMFPVPRQRRQAGRESGRACAEQPRRAALAGPVGAAAGRALTTAARAADRPDPQRRGLRRPRRGRAVAGAGCSTASFRRRFVARRSAADPGAARRRAERAPTYRLFLRADDLRRLPAARARPDGAGSRVAGITGVRPDYA